METIHELKVFIKEDPIMDQSELFVYDAQNVYNIKEGNILATKRQINEYVEHPEPFIKGQHWFIESLAIALSKHVESKGGITTDQLNKGKIEILKDNQLWMRSIIEKAFKN